MLRNLIDKQHPETGKWTCDCPSNNTCWECYRAESWWGEMVSSRPRISLTSIWIQLLAENSQRVVPTRTDYAMATVKEVLTLSQSAASVIPVPFLQEAIGLALKIIQLCEVRWISPLNVARRLIKSFIRKHLILKKKSKSCKLGLAILWSLLWTT